MAKPMRKSDRYTTFIPVDVEVDDSGASLSNLSIANLSCGGLGFRTLRPLFNGTALTLTFGDNWPAYIIRGEVAWCRARGGQYEVGVCFGHDSEAFKARMLAQLGQIERYMINVKQNEGRELSQDQAAREWIELYAEHFAQAVNWH
jgi:hypothetical protein